ncbi:MAG: AraC family transcriptional regulator [Saprospiraceae bacterium]|nr:AraC family transcriptional regulator [Saprospiraceae bacterium]
MNLGLPDYCHLSCWIDWILEITHLLLMKKYISTFKQFEGLELLRASFTTQYFKPHFHEQYALILVEQGKADYSYKGKIRVLDSGSILLLNPYEVHTGKSFNGEPWNFRSLYISQALFHQVHKEFTQKEYYPAFTTAVLQDPTFARLFSRVHEYLLSETEDVSAQTVVTNLLQALIERCSFEPMKADWGQVEKKAGAVKAYLEKHFLDQIRLDELEKELGFSKYYLIRVFESVYGLSPIRYTINLRIEESKRLLYSGMKYTEVAYATGFYDQSHFIRHFKLIVGVTPKDFC